MLKIGYYGLCVLFISLYSTHVNGYRLNTCVSQYPRFKSQLFMKIDDKQESKFSSFFGINRMSSSLLIAGAMLTNTFLPFSPFSNSNNLQAKTLSNLQQASILFQKSDDAYKLTENQYVKMENELKKTNQLIEKTILNKYKTVASKLNQYDKEFSALILRYNKLLADNDAIILTKYQAEINELEKLVEVKYAAAEKALESLNEAPKTSNKAPATPSSTSSSSTNNGPQKFTGYKGNPNNNNPNNRLLATSELFNKAKTEAMRLEENKKQYQLISDSIQSNQKINQQLNDYFIKTSSHYHSQIINLLNKIINHNRDEYYNFNNGIGINENICRYQLNDCILHGKEGLSNVQTAIDKYQENENDVLKYLTIVENEIRTYNDLKKEFQQSILTRLSTQLQSINQWEEMNKLALTKNKNLLLHYETELNTIFNALDKKYTTFIHDIEYGLASPTGNADYFNKNNNKNNGNILNLMTSNTKQSYESVIKSMKVVLENLEIADKTSKTAEKLLLEAKEQGDKEASVYLKSRALNGVPSSTNPATTTNNAPTTSTQTIVVKEVKVVKK